MTLKGVMTLNAHYLYSSLQEIDQSSVSPNLTTFSCFTAG